MEIVQSDRHAVYRGPDSQGARPLHEAIDRVRHDGKGPLVRPICIITRLQPAGAATCRLRLGHGVPAKPRGVMKTVFIKG
jgi:hypothetical protein